jgi:hypothetical protein
LKKIFSVLEGGTVEFESIEKSPSAEAMEKHYAKIPITENTQTENPPKRRFRRFFARG